MVKKELFNREIKMASLLEKLNQIITDWLMREKPASDLPLSDFERIRYELRPCDVLLIEGRSRISNIIKLITQSAWSHGALYIGRIHDIDNPVLRERLQQFYKGSPEDQLIIESLLGHGTVVSPLTNYSNDHIRICRPKGLSRHDAQKVIGFVIGRLGTQYGIRHLFDLARFLLPWSFMPRRWRSSLFEFHAGAPTHEICSSMIADAFSSVNFPILPLIRKSGEGYELYRRNTRLYTPSDFDYSPFFEIIKYPIFELEAPPAYQNLPWNSQYISNDDAGLFNPNNIHADEEKQKRLMNFLEKTKKAIGIEDKTNKEEHVEHLENDKIKSDNDKKS